jgi:hypothetical protein
MSTIRIRKHLDSETLVLPELRPLIGKTVEIRVREQPESPIDEMIDWEYLAELEAEFAEDPSPIPSLEEVRAALSSIPGSLTADIRAERDERG